MRLVRPKTRNGIPESEKDILDWLKFAQSETQGIKLNLNELDQEIEMELGRYTNEQRAQAILSLLAQAGHGEGRGRE